MLTATWLLAAILIGISPPGDLVVLKNYDPIKHVTSRFEVKCESADNCNILWKVAGDTNRKRKCFCGPFDVTKGKTCPVHFLKGKTVPSCYHFNSGPVTWFEALKKCESMEADLVSIETPEEQMYLVVTLLSSKEFNQTEMYTGGNDFTKDGHFYWWATGQPFTTNYWATGQPNNHENDNEDCMLLSDLAGFSWADISCSRRRGYICERPLL